MNKQPSYSKKQSGVSLPAVIVIVVVLGVISAGLVSLVATGNVAVGHEILSQRAFLAAESGAQNGMGRLFPVGGGGVQCNAFNVVFNNGGLQGCSVNVPCQPAGNFNGRDHYTLISTGQCIAGEATAIRTIQVGARN